MDEPENGLIRENFAYGGQLYCIYCKKPVAEKDAERHVKYQYHQMSKKPFRQAYQEAIDLVNVPRAPEDFIDAGRDSKKKKHLI